MMMDYCVQSKNMPIVAPSEIICERGHWHTLKYSPLVLMQLEASYIYTHVRFRFFIGIFIPLTYSSS